MSKERSEEKNYLGHRQRLKKRFAETGFQGFQDYEVLEFLLYFALPRRDTKKLAKKLLQRFGNIIAVLNADAEELAEIEGVGPHAKFFLKAMGGMIGFYFHERAKHADFQFTNLNQLVDYFRAAIGGNPNEVMRILYLNSKNRLIYAENLSEGTVSEAIAFPRKIVEGALKYRAATVILGHNHPGGLPEPSENDDAVTVEIKNALRTVGISLQEHVIVAPDGFFSYRQTGQLGGACG
jgi:DNA repair protein RadC